MSVNDAVRQDAAGDTVEAILNYVAPDLRSSRRFTFPGDEVNTGRFLPHRVPIHNARTAPERPTLDSHGFELFGHKSAIRNFHDRVEIDAVYPQEVMDAAQALTGADLILPLGYVLRNASETGNGQNQPPASDVHVDMSPETAPKGARALIEQAAPGKSYRRFLATSFWRPHSEPPQDWPVALCDHRTLAPEEGVPNRLVRRSSRPDPAEMLAPIADEDELPAALIFRFGAHHRWYYYPDMTRDEVLLIKLHDSDHGRAWFAAHTAFHDARRPGTHTRESIEFRTIAYWF
jgi:hypothetical protein